MQSFTAGPQALAACAPSEAKAGSCGWAVNKGSVRDWNGARKRRIASRALKLVPKSQHDKRLLVLFTER